MFCLEFPKNKKNVYQVKGTCYGLKYSKIIFKWKNFFRSIEGITMEPKKRDPFDDIERDMEI